MLNKKTALQCTFYDFKLEMVEKGFEYLLLPSKQLLLLLPCSVNFKLLMHGFIAFHAELFKSHITSCVLCQMSSSKCIKLIFHLL